MKSFLCAVFGIIMATTALAQPPKELIPEETVNLAVGQARVYPFDHSFREIKMPVEGVVQALAQNDRQLSLTGLTPGETPIFVYAPEGQLLWSATLIVGQERGHVVRLYDGKSPDHTGFYCDETFCGRADKELKGSREVSSITTVGPGGTATTRTFGGK